MSLRLRCRSARRRPNGAPARGHRRASTPPTPRPCGPGPPHVGGAGRQHRLDRVEHRQADRLEGSAALGQRPRRGATEIAREHRRPPDDGKGHVSGLGHRVGHQSGQRALAELAGEQAAEEVSLRFGGSPEQVGEERPAGGDRSRTGGGGQRREGGVQLKHLDRRRRRWPGVHAIGRPPPDADPALPGQAGQETHGRLHLVRGQVAKEGGQRLHLRRAQPGGRNGGRGGDDGSQEHGVRCR